MRRLSNAEISASLAQLLNAPGDAALAVSTEFLSRHLHAVESIVADAIEQQHPVRTLDRFGLSGDSVLSGLS